MAAHQLLRLDNLPEAVLRTVSRIVSGCTRMTRLIDQILDFARARYRGGIPVDEQPMDLHDVCAAVIGDLELQGAAGRIRLESEGPAQGVWDRDRLLQVVQNLVQNALRYAAPGPPVTIRLAPDGPGVTRLSVHNDGAPIPADLLPRIFEPFRRAPSPGSAAGLGLGLFIAREVVLAHGGDITVESSAGAGTTFHIRLPGASQ